MNSYIKDTNHFLRKIKSLSQLPEGAILCTIDAIDFNPNIPHEEGLTRTQKIVTTETLNLQKLF